MWIFGSKKSNTESSSSMPVGETKNGESFGLAPADLLWCIKYEEWLRYKIWEKLSTYPRGQEFTIEACFSMPPISTEYVEFIKLIGWLSTPSVFQTKAELEDAIANHADDLAYQKKIANTFVSYGNSMESTRWYAKAAEKGDAEALTRLAGAYSYGFGVKKDEKRAVELLIQAIVEDAFPDALLDLGLKYTHGEGVEKDPKRAFWLMERSARQGNMLAQNNLGYFYREGLGIAQDIRKALYWYEQSASQGYEDAIKCLHGYYSFHHLDEAVNRIKSLAAHFNINL